MMDYLKKPVFVVGDINEDINLSLPPSSGEEYIKRVVIEARQCADVVVANLDPSCVKKPTKAYVETKSCNYRINMTPDINSQNAWISFCLGSKEKIEPTLNTLFCFSQSNTEQVLEYLVQFVETERKVEYKIGQWIYALLVILEQPLQPDTCSCLRSLARACSIIRVDTLIKLIQELDAQELGALNLFICLVARYFRQLDLADP
ncbi:Survival of motor neuron protein-interacting protein 1 [Cyphomyrmex costatus]|uniref:Survival of motor neuron protein-interacting protein 1 n=1 Tax=Cyphomyrmex costatus TaxID=456900 RepID=A0A151IHJ4_9HYME|nr:Survival of motor neuron protein-interacting protein 1 [Cyphomyrmex costatus]